VAWAAKSKPSRALPGDARAVPASTEDSSPVSVDSVRCRSSSRRKFNATWRLPVNFQATALYASILTVLAIVLANIVSAKRGSTGISILHGDNRDLALWMRRHGNLVENLPLALILMALCEARGLAPLWLNVIGVTLVVARLLHLGGLDATNAKAPLRIVGGVGTQLCMLGAVGYLLWSLLTAAQKF
jgi:uncharacterized protein